MLDRMHPEQFNEWLASYNTRPWGIELPVEEQTQQSSFQDSLAAMRRQAGV